MANGHTGSWEFRPRTFPGINANGGTWAKYEDGSFVDYTSLAWKQIEGWTPPTEYQQIWGAIPDSWKVGMSGMPPNFRLNLLYAIATQNGAMAQQVQQAAAEYAKAIKAGEQQPQPEPFFQASNPQIVPSPYGVS